MNKGDLVTINGYLYEYVEKARSWKGYLIIVRSLITEEASVQFESNVYLAKDQDIINFLEKFI